MSMNRDGRKKRIKATILHTRPRKKGRSLNYHLPSFFLRHSTKKSTPSCFFLFFPLECILRCQRLSRSTQIRQGIRSTRSRESIR